MPNTPIKTFICYAREDRQSLDMLMGHLAVFERSGAVQIWYDRAITGGKDWDEEIRFNLKSADIVLLLISPAFFLSDYIHSVELDEALRRDREREALVVPIILQKCLWHKHPEIARLQALPAEARPIFDKNHWPDPHDGFYDAAEGFDRILDDPDTEARRQRRAGREQKEAAARIKQAAAEEKKRQETEAEAAIRKLLPEMVLVEGGTFQMGEKGIAGPVHQVTLSDFEIAKTPVTVEQYLAFANESGSHFPEWTEAGSDYNINTGKEDHYKKLGAALQGFDCPIVGVSWDDAVAYCRWLSEKTGKKFRLPTEAEWEYAARGGAHSKGFQYAGSNNLNEAGWFWENSGDKPLSGEWNEHKIYKNNCCTQPVGRKKPNELGLYDMSGNVWEWCADWYGDYSSESQTNSTGPKNGSSRVFRGGSWVNDALRCRVSYRGSWKPDGRGSHLGFRLASSPK